MPKLKDIPFNQRDRFFQIGIAISTLRRVRGMSQEELAAKANISRTMLGNIEAPNLPRNFSMVAFFSIADALDVDPADLLKTAMLPDKIINKKKKTEK